MMEKKFFDVFPKLLIDGELKDYVEEAKVTRVTSNPSKTRLRVYLNSRQWIHKKNIYALERSIREQFFPGLPMEIKIIEDFQLSRQYTPENFWEVYRDSLLLELKEYSAVLYNLLIQGKLEFEGQESLRITLPDTVISRERGEELERILDKVFCERCHFALQISVEYVQAKESRARINSEQKIQEEARHLQETADAAREQAAMEEVKGSTKETKEKQASGKTRENGKKQQTQNKSFRGRQSRPGIRRSANPDVIYGRDFEEDAAVTIDSIVGEMGDVVIRGKILSVDSREIRNEKTILMFNVTDFTDTITVKMFLPNAQVAETAEQIKKGAFVKIKGVTIVDKFDHELTIGSVIGIKKIPDFTTSRVDTSPVKRVELHCHTKMSDMDGVTDAAALVKRAYSWGHPAIAITDHGVAQSFPEANHALEDIDRAYRDQYAKDPM